MIILLAQQACTCSMWRRLFHYLLFVLSFTAAFVTIKFEQVPLVSQLLTPRVTNTFHPSVCYFSLSLTASLSPFLSPSPSLSVRIPPYLSEQGEPDRCRAEERKTERRQGKRRRKGSTRRKSRRNKGTYRVCTNRKEERQFGSRRRVREEFYHGS